MASGKNGQRDFSRLIVALVVLAVTALAVTGLTAHQRNHSTSEKNITAATIPVDAQPQSAISAQPAYAAWPTRSNTTYGFSFNYPTGWATSGDTTYDPKTSATRQEFGTSILLGATEKSSSAASIEVLDEPLKTAEAWYDQYYAQTSIKVNKTAGILKDKRSLVYHFVAPTYETKLYLFAVDPKTYLFSSVNESLNTDASASYWSDFDNIFNSLTISK